MADAAALKEEGNALFKANDLRGAEEKYSAAIAANGSDATNYANRSMVRVKLGDAAGGAADAAKATEIDAAWYKGWVRFAQAQLALGDAGTAEAAVARAREAATAAGVAAAGSVIDLVAAAVATVKAATAAATTALGDLLSMESLKSLPSGSSDGGDAGADGAGAGAGAAGSVTVSAAAGAGSGSAGSAAALDAAAAKLASAMLAVPGSRALALTRARTLHGAGRFQSADAVLQGVIGFAADTEAQVLVAACKMGLGDFDGAVAAAQRALKVDPECSPAASLVRHAKAVAAAKEAGNTVYKSGDYAGATKAYTAAIQLSSTAAMLPRGVAVLHNNLAAALLAENKAAEAEAACTRALQAHPYSAKVYDRRAKCRLNSNPAGALEDLRTAQWLDPQSGGRARQAGLVASANAVARAQGKSHASGIVHVNDEDVWPGIVKAAGDRLIVVDYFASWCGPCKMIAPSFERMSLEFSHCVFVKVDGDACGDFVAEAGVTGFPTFHLYRNGRKVDELVGADEGTLIRKVAAQAASAGAANPATGRLPDAPDAALLPRVEDP